jgi:hypothetical protein
MLESAAVVRLRITKHNDVVPIQKAYFARQAEPQLNKAGSKP